MNEPELRPCPFCGDLQGCWHLDLSLQNGSPEQWNRRPLEDALRAELEAAELEIQRLEQHCAAHRERAEAAEARVRELEALEAQCAIEPGQESTYDVPALVAKAMWRFWFRLAKIRGARIAELEAHFPRTADGVAVTPGMVLELLRDKAAEVRDGE